MGLQHVREVTLPRRSVHSNSWHQPVTHAANFSSACCMRRAKASSPIPKMRCIGCNRPPSTAMSKPSPTWVSHSIGGAGCRRTPSRPMPGQVWPVLLATLSPPPTAMWRQEGCLTRRLNRPKHLPGSAYRAISNPVCRQHHLGNIWQSKRHHQSLKPESTR